MDKHIPLWQEKDLIIQSERMTLWRRSDNAWEKNVAATLSIDLYLELSQRQLRRLQKNLAENDIDNNRYRYHGRE